MQSKNAQKRRRKYDASFKQEVVSMIAAGHPVPEIARSLSIEGSGKTNWVVKGIITGNSVNICISISSQVEQ